ncbi:MAG: helix-turn-helix domain-containing protein [Victivallaceae bacterium]|nr:helix-turn-helix domain-containing protein [Victivallaceae bacterium]
MNSVYGNEWKDYHTDLLSPEQLATLSGIQETLPPLVINVSHWHCVKNWRVPPRRIMDNLLLIVCSGRIEVELEGEKRILGKGEYVLIPENALHSYGIAEGEESCSNYVLHLLSLLQRPGNLFDCFRSPFRKLHHPEALFEQLDLGIALRNHVRTLGESFVAQGIRVLAREALLDGDYLPRIRQERDSRVARILAFIHQNYTANISICDIAAAVQLKEVQFRRIFQREIGMTPANYLHRQRLLHAVPLLLRGSEKLDDIAAASGFHSTSYFCRSFRKFYRMTPAQFRQSYR